MQCARGGPRRELRPSEWRPIYQVSLQDWALLQGTALGSALYVQRTQNTEAKNLNSQSRQEGVTGFKHRSDFTVRQERGGAFANWDSSHSHLKKQIPLENAGNLTILRPFKGQAGMESRLLPGQEVCALQVTWPAHFIRLSHQHDLLVHSNVLTSDGV